MEKSCICFNFQNDENEKELLITANKDCLVLNNTLQITYMCFFFCLEKNKLSDVTDFGKKSSLEK